MEEPLKFKVVLIGESGVGKTSILQRYISNEFNSNQFSTIGSSYVEKIIKIGKNKIGNMGHCWPRTIQSTGPSILSQYRCMYFSI